MREWQRPRSRAECALWTVWALRGYGHGVAGLSTERLWLRRWRASDRAPFAALNADPAVMQYFPASLSRAESDELIDRIEWHDDIGRDIRRVHDLWGVRLGGIDGGPAVPGGRGGGSQW